MHRSAAASFLGSHTNRIDAKGRVAAPADFRKALDLSVFNGFFCIPSLEGDALDCGGPDYIEGLKAMIQGLDPFDEGRRALEEHLLGAARPINFDADGRFILHKDLRAHANIEGDVFFIGLGDTFQMRRPAEEAVRTKEQTALALSALKRLKNPGVPQGVHPGNPGNGGG